jgi:hypothetical protein
VSRRSSSVLTLWTTVRLNCRSNRVFTKAAAVGRQRIERGNSEHLILPLHSLAQQCRPFENSETFLQFPSLI